MFAANQPPPLKSSTTPSADRPESRLKSGRLSSLKGNDLDGIGRKSPTFVSERTYTAFARGARPSTSRTITSAQSSSCRDGKINENGTRTGPRMDKQTTPAMSAMEPAFLCVGKDSVGQSIWRLEVKNKFSQMFINKSMEHIVVILCQVYFVQLY